MEAHRYILGAEFDVNKPTAYFSTASLFIHSGTNRDANDFIFTNNGTIETLANISLSGYQIIVFMYSQKMKTHKFYTDHIIKILRHIPELIYVMINDRKVLTHRFKSKHKASFFCGTAFDGIDNLPEMYTQKSFDKNIRDFLGVEYYIPPEIFPPFIREFKNLPKNFIILLAGYTEGAADRFLTYELPLIQANDPRFAEMNEYTRNTIPEVNEPQGGIVTEVLRPSVAEALRLRYNGRIIVFYSVIKSGKEIPNALDFNFYDQYRQKPDIARRAG